MCFLFGRSHLENILGHGHPGSMKRPALTPMQSNPLPPEFPPPQFNNYEDYGDHLLDHFILGRKSFHIKNVFMFLLHRLGFKCCGHCDMNDKNGYYI